MNPYKVSAKELNLRSAPVIKASTVLATLPEGQVVYKIQEADKKNWWKVSTKIQGTLIEGYINQVFVEKLSGQSEEAVELPQVLPLIPEVHLTPTGAIKRSDTRRAFPLNEDKQPRRMGTNEEERSDQLLQIIKWLNVDSNKRYLPGSATTYCNIYAYDYCFLAGCYLPRVWWTRKAIALIAAGTPVKLQYAATVTELNANSLYNWFEEFGTDFGWRRTMSMEDLQVAANEGQVGIIVGQRTDLNRSGHICAVVPESAGHKAKRDKQGKITVPLQSQAGANNFLFGGRVWWTGTQFRKFSFWIHA